MAAPITPSSLKTGKRSPSQIQRAVLVALVIRDLRSRVEGRWLSLLWMLFEPLAHVLLMMALFGFRHQVTSVNTEYPVFLVTGMLPFFLFRNLARRIPAAINSSRGLYAYRQIKPLDALLGRAIVEIALYGAVFLTVLLLLGWLGYVTTPVAPLELAGVLFVLLACGLALGLIFAVLGHERPKVQSVIGMAFIPLYLLSGIIFPVQNLPMSVREWLLWNPVLHLIDHVRLYFLPHHQELTGSNLAYPTAFTLCALALAMSSYRLYRHRLIATS
jgi:capsular polysaccharide transport system permease protein